MKDDNDNSSVGLDTETNPNNNMKNSEMTTFRANNWKRKARMLLLVACSITQIAVAAPSRASTTAIGAGVGAGAGIGAGAAIGGVGVVCCGTGFGIPVGIVCFILAGVGAACGGGVGYAVGSR